MLQIGDLRSQGGPGVLIGDLRSQGGPGGCLKISGGTIQSFRGEGIDSHFLGRGLGDRNRACRLAGTAHVGMAVVGCDSAWLPGVVLAG